MKMTKLNLISYFIILFLIMTSCESRFINNYKYITDVKNGRIFNTMENCYLICLDSSYFNGKVNFNKVTKVKYFNGSFKLKYVISDTNEYNICIKYEDVYFRSGKKMRKKTYKKLAPDMNEKGIERIRPLLNSDWELR